MEQWIGQWAGLLGEVHFEDTEMVEGEVARLPLDWAMVSIGIVMVECACDP